MAVQRAKRQAELTDAKQAPLDYENAENSLRPTSLHEYIGQTRLKRHLMVHIQAACTRKEPLGHTLLHGPPGLGKTTLAYIIAQEMRAQIRITSGPVIEKPGDLASLLTSLQKGDVLFVDEIHRLRPHLEEVLYGAMEDSVLDIMIGKGPSARPVRLQLQPFTLVGATTKAGAMSAPLRDRFLHHFKLGFYELPEVRQIINRSARILEVRIENQATHLLAQASRATPRIANRLVRAVRDFALVQKQDVVTISCVKDALQSLEIDDEGLDATDRALLRVLVTDFNGNPVGLSTLAAILAEEQGTIEDVYEPYLIQQGFIQRTPKGRIATRKAYEKIGMVGS
ncbi:Holliday junction DNA helicase RuvB [Candidatus Peribacteria bacterium RIFCSPHIGHO2_02_FULL_49_16]|nr:MAG: Holliday junction DNA helicase RuvB [Candidatus Peribacteria bacterium RIFCSPHIGHO2_01_FULL_49_38]OGJ58542.1 MAG: Holliday junction DNA helicase RuvB [Candidatus Peribacteria bacterium RIFCSPHIGHO2_02_FULL_49_16]